MRRTSDAAGPTPSDDDERARPFHSSAPMSSHFTMGQSHRNLPDVLHAAEADRSVSGDGVKHRSTPGRPSAVNDPGDPVNADRAGPGPSSVTWIEAGVNLTNCVMGAGALSLPSFFKSCGVATGTVLLVASCAWTWASVLLMLLAAEAASKIFGQKIASYEDLMLLTLGKRGAALSSCAIVLLQIGCLVGYANILADVFSPFAIDVLPPGLEPNRSAILTAVTMGCVLPVGLFVGGDNPSLLATVSTFSLVIVATFCVVMATHAFFPETNPGPTGALPGPVVFSNPAGVMSVLPLAIFAFGAHPAILPVTSVMDPGGRKACTRLTSAVLLVCLIGYLLIGLGGYLAFRSATAGNVLRNLDGVFLGPSASKTLKFGYGLVILGSVPTILLPLQNSAKDVYVTLARSLGRTAHVRPARAAYQPPGSPGNGDTASAPGDVSDAIRFDVSPEIAARLSQTVALVSCLAALTLALYVPNVEFAFGLTGSTCSFLIAFVLPGMAYLKVTTSGAKRRGGRAVGAWDAGGEHSGGFGNGEEGGGGSKGSASAEATVLTSPRHHGGWSEWETGDSDADAADEELAVLGGDFGKRGSSVASARRRRHKHHWVRLAAGANIVAAVVLSFFCTQEVIRELRHEQALVHVVTKMAVAKSTADVIDRQSEHIAHARDSFVGSHQKLVGAMANATAHLTEAEERLDTLRSFSPDVADVLEEQGVDPEVCATIHQEQNTTSPTPADITATADALTAAPRGEDKASTRSPAWHACKERLSQDAAAAKVALRAAKEELQRAALEGTRNSTDATIHVSSHVSSAGAIAASLASTLDYINDTLVMKMGETPSPPPPPPEGYFERLAHDAAAIIAGRDGSAAAKEKKRKSAQKEAADTSNQALSAAAKMSIAVASLKALEEAHGNMTDSQAALESALGLDTPAGAPLAEEWLRGASDKEWKSEAYNPFEDYDQPRVNTAPERTTGSDESGSSDTASEVDASTGGEKKATSTAEKRPSALNATAVVAIADKKIEELSDKRAQAASEFEQALSEAKGEGVDEVRAASLANIMPTLQKNLQT